MRLRVLPLSLTEILTGGGLDHHPKYLYNAYRGGLQVLSRCPGRRSRRGSGVIRSWKDTRDPQVDGWMKGCTRVNEYA
jgi:hypothetical protein